MKRKFLALLLSVFVVFSLFAREPSKDFPFIIHERDEGYTFRSFNLSYKDLVESEYDNDMKIEHYKKNNYDYLVIYTDVEVEDLEEVEDLFFMLALSSFLWGQWKEEYGNYDLCLIFLDEYGDFLFSAQYCEYE